MNRRPPFELRARFHGILDWTCPWCANLNRSRVNRTAWRIQCKGKDCRRRFTFGVLLQSLAKVQYAGRPQLPPPDVAFPAATLNYWTSGANVNRLVQDPEEDHGQQG